MINYVVIVYEKVHERISTQSWYPTGNFKQFTITILSHHNSTQQLAPKGLDDVGIYPEFGDCHQVFLMKEMEIMELIVFISNLITINFQVNNPHQYTRPPLNLLKLMESETILYYKTTPNLF